MEAQNLALTREAEVHVLPGTVAEPARALVKVPKEVFRTEVSAALQAYPHVCKICAPLALPLVQFHHLVLLRLCVR